MSPAGAIPAGSDPQSARELLAGEDPVSHDYLDQHAAPPMPDELPREIGDIGEPPQPVYDRLMSRSYTLQTAWAGLLILPNDPNRKKLLISGTFSSGIIYISDSRDMLGAAARTSGINVYKLTTGVVLDLGTYNGPIWAWTDTDTNVVNVIAVTN